ncbi:hypothetical protein CEX73_01445 [Candidatus Palibaumannia cicadellinicola]|uniref:YCII-related domain-containing protein n=1 Tax=Candidatus Palibaumannia cicadellinicola TaxID=186490 RepID=A0A2N4XX37_9GAMM|nr:YciI family protein [Candidatus Baumannia cicadellinicola]PLK58824.1 hypothetical protein CEX73_01445 [Candidatus Baumannia cicadellinicola]
MLYVINAECVTDSLENRKLIDLAPLQLLQNQGLLLTAGLTTVLDSYDPGTAGFNGYTIIAEFDSLESAQAWVEQNLYIAANIYATVVVKPYQKCF